MQTYDPQSYWSRVGQDVQQRGKSYMAGDDNPFYRYKRDKFLKRFLDSIDFRDGVVLEVGFGPGGNLRHIAENHNPKKLLGADISQTMFEIASRNVAEFGDRVELHKINGKELPFLDKSVDLSYTVTVLQHVTDQDMFVRLVKEICRVTIKQAVIMEDIGSSGQRGGPGSFIRRKLDVYKSVFSECGFELADIEFLNTRFSALWHHLVFQVLYRGLLNRRQEEGQPIGAIIQSMIGLPLIPMRFLDDLFVEKKHLAKMVFRPS